MLDRYLYEVALLSSVLEPLTYYSDRQIDLGSKIVATLRSRSVEGVVVATVKSVDFECEPILEVLALKYTKVQIQMAKFMSQYYFCSLGEALALMVADSHHSGCMVDEVSTQIELSVAQLKALKFAQQHTVSLLFGDTGSGKSEIYMKWFEQVIGNSKRALLLMPEISLTPQMQQRLESHFGKRVVMYHSRLSKKKRTEAIEMVRSGEAYIIAGARSALFLPIQNLGLIVVDEEHDDSYKASNRPRYNAKDMAIYYGSLLKIPTLLGSATPSLSSYKKFPHFRVRGGYHTSSKLYEFERSLESITPRVESSIKECVDNKKQAMLFIPTRANFKYLICRDCGSVSKCIFCSVGLSLHRKFNHLRCHYCGYSSAIPRCCSECGGELKSSRIGTAEAVEHFSKDSFGVRVAQFDRDSITTQKKLVKLLEMFNNKKIDLLIGTQMLSKGHDYHGVSLAVVLGLDNILSQSDYRARERAMSLLVQIAGRSGRRDSSLVLVQTLNEEFFKSYLADYESFLKDELTFRVDMYPPYKKLCRVLFAHKNAQKASEAAEQMSSELRKFTTVEVVGSSRAPIEKIASMYRYVILLRADKSTDLIRAIRAVRHPLAQIDMDPIEFS